MLKQVLLPRELYAKPCQCLNLGVHCANEKVSNWATLIVCHDDYICGMRVRYKHITKDYKGNTKNK